MNNHHKKISKFNFRCHRVKLWLLCESMLQQVAIQRPEVNVDDSERMPRNNYYEPLHLEEYDASVKGVDMLSNSMNDSLGISREITKERSMNVS